ncbi:MAG: P1 family peptidase [Gaiellaceae bacterium]
MRARDLGIAIGDLEPGPLNAITDVAGVRVGHTTLVEGDDVRTGVTVVIPGELPCFAAPFRLNGNGEVTGLQWMRESGLLTTPIAVTNTHSVGAVHEALVAAALVGDRSTWSLPVVAETWDGVLNDVNGFHVRPEHARAALDSASDGSVPEGNVGGGTGMICHGFKAGIGTASRFADAHTVGVLVQANHGVRARLAIDGVPVGRMIGADRVPLPPRPALEGAGSIVVVVATDAPLLPHQCERVALRSMLGVARTGGAGETSSGDFALAFATGSTRKIEPMPSEAMNPLFYAAIEATEEAIVNALVAAETMSGLGGATAHALPHDLLAVVMHRYGRSSTTIRADA